VLPLASYNNTRICYALPIASFILRLTNRMDLMGKSVEEQCVQYGVLCEVYELMWRVKNLNLDYLVLGRRAGFLERHAEVFEGLLRRAGGAFLGGEGLTVPDLFFY
jgi:hypothetical protein